jgi:hypothetical protein
MTGNMKRPTRPHGYGPDESPPYSLTFGKHTGKALKEIEVSYDGGAGYIL